MLKEECVGYKVRGWETCYHIRQSSDIVKLLFISVLGKVEIFEMINLNGERIDQIDFNTINIRNFGTLYADNGRAKRILHGRNLRVYPGGLLQGTNLVLNVENVNVDVMGKIEVDYRGHKPGGANNSFSIQKHNYLYTEHLSYHFL